ncbi:MAG: primosomal protein N', partial [Campylobacterota bacterium]|nr:primosomal protein N' [Campylobacterota bacterium]
MYYYFISLLGSPLEALVFSSQEQVLPNTLVKVPLKSQEKRGVFLRETQKPSFKTEHIISVENAYFSDAQISLASFISEYYVASLGEALMLMTPLSTVIEAQEKKLTCAVKNEEVLLGCKEKIKLNTKQSEAFEFIKKEKISLLFGDTGSGKTEIYMKYFQELTHTGKRALFLLPEISLTPQMKIRFEVHFGDAFVLWHSKMSKKQKEKTLESILTGQAMIIAGPRSALFLPIENLGIIVVDEEHDDSYKSSSRPRYHARDVAIYMGKQLGIPVVLGSATPSLTSYVKFPHFRLKGGYHESSRDFIFEPSREVMSPLLEEAVSRNVQAKRQGILFIPTRANFKYLICEACGYTLECPFCSVGMSLHVKSNA